LKSFNAYLDKNKNLQKIEPPTLVKENDYSLGGLQDARQLIIWANGAKAGDVSEPYSIGDDFVVGVVTKIVPEGLPDAETIRPQVEYLVRNAKKAETIKAKLTNTPTLETAAAAYPNLQVATAGADSSLTFSSSAINGVLNEPKLIGASFNKTYQTKVSEPIEGLTGVYVLKVNSTGTKNLDIPANNSKQKTMAQQMAYGWFEGLKKNATIKDERSKSN
jgi:peptidyl-prolyl cis-trans isomerase D